jgi:hypothetical protein
VAGSWVENFLASAVAFLPRAVRREQLGQLAGLVFVEGVDGAPDVVDVCRNPVTPLASIKYSAWPGCRNPTDVHAGR